MLSQIQTGRSGVSWKVTCRRELRAQVTTKYEPKLAELEPPTPTSTCSSKKQGVAITLMEPKADAEARLS